MMANMIVIGYDKYDTIAIKIPINIANTIANMLVNTMESLLPRSPW